MQTLQNASDTFFHILQSFAVLISERPDDAELDDKPASECHEEIRILRSVQKALERRLVLVCQKRNTFAPINTLPSELLINIFAIATSNPRDTVSSDNATLSLVCHYWNRLVDTTPSLWARINEETMSVGKVIRALEKSQNAPLEIACTSRVPGREEREAILDNIFRHAHRWRKVSLAFWGAYQGLDVMTTLSTPLLESLSISVRGYCESGRRELDLFGSRPPPRLRKLYLEVLPLTWNPITLCNLTTLSISHVYRLGPSLDQLMAVISACPDLEFLSISEVAFSGDATTSFPNPIHLPALARLVLRTLTPAITNRLLAFIHAPNCISGELDFRILGDPLQTLFTSDVSYFLDHIRSNPSGGSITCYHREFDIRWMGPWNIQLRVENITLARENLIWLSSSSPIPIQMTIGSPSTQRADDVLAVVADMEALYRINFGNDAVVSKALTFLATCGLAQVSNPSGWPFPGLVEVSFARAFKGDNWEKLLLMLQRRQGVPETQGDAQHPKPLRKLEFGQGTRRPGVHDPEIANFSSTYWPNRLDEVRRLLGPEGELIWYGSVVTEEGVLEDRVVSRK